MNSGIAGVAGARRTGKAPTVELAQKVAAGRASEHIQPAPDLNLVEVATHSCG